MKRKNLFEEPSIDPKKVEVLTALLDDIESKIASDIAVDTEIKDFLNIAGKPSFYAQNDFETYWKAISKEEFINDALTPSTPLIEALTKEEILFILNKISTSNFADYYLQLLEKNTRYSYSLSDLIFWPNELGYDLNLEKEDMAEIIFKNKKPPKATDLPPPIVNL